MLLTILFRDAGIALQILIAAARTLSPHDYDQSLFVLSVVLPTYFLARPWRVADACAGAPKLSVKEDRRTRLAVCWQ